MNLQVCAELLKNPYPVPMTLLHILDLLSTFIFALVGARVAADKGLDYGGIAFIAGIASVSGGTLRNVFLGMRPIWVIDIWRSAIGYGRIRSIGGYQNIGHFFCREHINLSHWEILL